MITALVQEIKYEDRNVLSAEIHFAGRRISAFVSLRSPEGRLVGRRASFRL
jgi:hypothetical protein